MEFEKFDFDFKIVAKIAAEQDRKIPSIVEKDDIPQEKQKEIRELIKQLGDEKASVRKNAKAKLAELGLDALPILEEFLDDPDPEIKMYVKELLGK